MDMKKILAALDSVSERKPQGVDDMKRFVSIIKESTAPVEENVITGFEEGSVGGDANAFLIAADQINDLVMSQIEKIKINADEASLRDMMEKFNAFMTAYHNVGKGILQPDMFNDSLGESGLQYHTGVKKHGKDYMTKAAKLMRNGGSQEELGRLRDKESKAYKENSVAEGSAHGYNVARYYAKYQDQRKITNWLRKNAGLDKTAPVYFDDADLVYGDETIVPNALVDSKYKMSDLLAAVKQAASSETEGLDKIRDKHDKYNEGLSFLDYLNLAEATGKQKGVDGKACWDGYKRVGTKKKGGKTVDNCVPTGKK